MRTIYYRIFGCVWLAIGAWGSFLDRPDYMTAVVCAIMLFGLADVLDEVRK